MKLDKQITNEELLELTKKHLKITRLLSSFAERKDMLVL